jgi:hypothetical protein
VSAALACTESDVDRRNREVRVRGTKAHNRDRIVRVAEWAWPHLEAHVSILTSGERLFGGIDRWNVGDVHRAALVALGLPHHRVHDARHFYAIRAVRAGTPYELVARQLGHVDVAMVARIYGRYAPRSDERDRWERIASELDRLGPMKAHPQNSGFVGTVLGTARKAARTAKVANPKRGSDFPDSRGGTRTRDPGIMSAVL